MRLRHTISIAMLIQMFGTVPPARAGQAVHDAAAAENCLQDIRTGTLLRVRRDSVVTEGKMQSIRSGFLYIEASEGQHSLDLEQVDGIWVRGNRARKGARIGGLTVGILGALGGAAIVAIVSSTSAANSSATGSEYVGGVVAGGLLGLTLGGATGALVGTLFRGWDPVCDEPVPNRHLE